jgi:hypothetical protein
LDIVRKRGIKGSQGNAVSEYSDIIARSGSWQYGNDATANDIEDEKREEDLAFGVPHEAMDFDPKKGMLAMASDAANNIAKAVTDKVKSVKDSYKGAMQQNSQMGSELKETQRSYELGRQALAQGQNQPKDSK